MKYLQTDGNKVVLRYPLTMPQIASEYDLEVETLEGLNIFPVEPTRRRKNRVGHETQPKHQGGKWVQAWAYD